MNRASDTRNARQGTELMDNITRHDAHQNDIDAATGIPDIPAAAHAAIRIIKGDILHTPTPDAFEVCEDGYIIVANGTVQQVTSNLPS